jgi:uncharacterized membrane protein (DUF2068 family)
MRKRSAQTAAPTGERRSAPGSRSGRRPRIHYELIDCGFHGHKLLGTDVEVVRAEDALVLREPGDGLRWHRCLRCDAWVPLTPPARPTREHLPPPDQVVMPLRGRRLRDRYVLRLIALDRIVHFLVLGLLAATVLLFTINRLALSPTFYRVLDAVQGGVGGPSGGSGAGLLDKLRRLFAAKSSTLWVVGLVLAGYALLEGVEAVGLWLGKRWAEYLTFIATTLLLIPEVDELTGRITPGKITTLAINVVVVLYLLFAKRLFGLRGGVRAGAAEAERDSGWGALQRTLPTTAEAR